MNRLILSVATVLFAVTEAPALADTVPGPAGSDVTVYAPSGWKTQAAEHGGNAILVAVAPKEDAALLYAVVTAKDAGAAMAIVDDVMATMVTDVKVTKGAKTKVGGMPALALAGTGTAVDGGKPVSLAAVLVKTNADHMLIAVGLAHTDQKRAYAGEFKKALAGIRHTP